MNDNEWQKLISAARAQGWTIEVRRNSHLKWVSPDGKSVFTSSTPSDHRAVKNARRDLRKAGLMV